MKKNTEEYEKGFLKGYTACLEGIERDKANGFVVKTYTGTGKKGKKIGNLPFAPLIPIPEGFKFEVVLKGNKK